MKLPLIDQAYECQALIDFTQVQYYLVLAATSMVKLNDAWGFFVKLQSPYLVVHAKSERLKCRISYP